MPSFCPASAFAGRLLLLAALLATGCDRFAAPESMLDEYVTRLGRVLDVEPRLSDVPVAPELPRRRERVRPLPELNVGMLDFLGLYGCELQHVVGERNSSLGRVMHPATRLDYELRFLRAAEDCRGKLSRESLIERLDDVVGAKRESLPSVAWNAVWGTREIEDLLTRSRGALRVAPDQDAIADMAHDLRTMEASMTRVAAGHLDVDVRALDAVYQRWLGQPLVGQLVRSAVLLTVRLNDAAELVEARLGDRPLCFRKMGNRRAENMHGVFRAVFIGHVQPYLAAVHRSRREVLPSMQALSAIGGRADSEAFILYAEQALHESGVRSHWAALDTAIRRHTEAWQSLLEQCGMRPGLQH